jgi:ATP-dependent Clp protease adaptor protein ClpS
MPKKKSKSNSNVDLLDREKEKKKVSPPSKYQVVFYNDDYTTMELVVIILMDVFRHSTEKSYQIMMNVHEKGRGIAGGPYSREIAETKAEKCIQIARALGFPLLAVAEKV